MVTTAIRRKKKLTNAEILERVEHIMDLLAQNKKRAQILQDPVVVSWQMSNGSVDKYIKHAKDDIALNVQQGKEEHLSRSVLNLSYLYKVALEKKDYRLCLDIQKELNRLLRLDEAYRSPGQLDKQPETPVEVRELVDSIKILNAPAV